MRSRQMLAFFVATGGMQFLVKILCKNVNESVKKPFLRVFYVLCNLLKCK